MIPSPREAGSPPAHLTVATVNENGRPLAGAEVYVADYSERIPILDFQGSTNAAGILTVAERPDAPVWIGARFEGRTQAEVYCHDALPHFVELALRAAGSIHGRVVTHDGTGVEGLGVLAWPTPVKLPPADLAVRGALGDPRVHLAHSGPGGAFRLGGLRAGTPFSLVAAGEGYSTASPLIGAVAGPHPVEIEVARLHGVRLRLREADGAPLVLDPRLVVGGRLPLDTGAVAGVRYISRPNFALVLGNGAGSETTDGDRSVRFEYLFASHRHVERLGPFPFRLDLPGYDTLEAEVWAGPVLDGVVSEQVLTLERSDPPDGHGSLELLFEGATVPSLTSPFLTGGRGTLSLTAESGGALQFAVEAGERVDPIFVGIPAGRYGARFRSPGGLFSHPPAGDPPEEVVVLAARRATWVVDLAACGRVSLVAVDSKGGRYTGPLTLLLLRGGLAGVGGEAPGTTVFFERSPYVMPIVPAGAVGLRPFHPPSAGPGGRLLPVTGELLPGATLELTLSIAD
ncbi:MAG: hypothetical protein CMJ84_02395 [Planctomycetes bacterium]|jgi:hypothetical protein|nr:hypothetical protein [Planctomycetota bacterium]MDP6408412.1 hypothetical protein [Planctomycetota bacterium]